MDGQPIVRWVEDNPRVHRLFIDEQYIGKLAFTVEGDTVVHCQFVSAADHKRTPISLTRLMVLAAKQEVVNQLKLAPE